MTKPGMIITGATGFLGKRLVDCLRDEYEIFGIGRRTPAEAGLPEGPGLHWFQADISDFEPLREVFYQIQSEAKIDILLHLAAFYDFTGDNNPAYTRTNVTGTRNVLELSVPLKLKRFFFTSSVAACPFPEQGEAITENTPPTAPVYYAQSKRKGEDMIHQYQDRVPACIIRLAAIFSNWCEYEPLATFIQTWCSDSWNSRILGGDGLSAIPYLHARDLLKFYLRVIELYQELENGEILQASPNGCTTHLELYQEVCQAFYGSHRKAIYIPQFLARPGIMMREMLGRLTGDMPFERAWMADYIDLQLNINATQTHRRLNWTPTPELEILGTIPVMVQNLRESPYLWKERCYKSSISRLQNEQAYQNYLYAKERGLI
jgi:nucleoside-diphosphate-sugar epimerase